MLLLDTNVWDVKLLLWLVVVDRTVENTRVVVVVRLNFMSNRSAIVVNCVKLQNRTKKGGCGVFMNIYVLLFPRRDDDKEINSYIVVV